MNTTRQYDGLLVAGISAVAIASSVIAFATWVGVALYVVAIALLFTSVVRNAKTCTLQKSEATTAGASGHRGASRT